MGGEIEGKSDEVQAEATLNPSVNLQLRGWPDEDRAEAEKLGYGLLRLAKEVSLSADLSRLRSIIVGQDYSEALRSIAPSGGAPFVATDNEFATGAAMATSQFVDGELWSDVVIWAPLVRNIFNDAHAESGRACQMFVHELMHVSDTSKFIARSVNGIESFHARGEREGHLQAIGNPLRSEYSSQRPAAWIVPDYGFEYLDTLEDVLRESEGQIRKAKNSFFQTKDFGALWNEVAERVRFLFQALGYALGHIEGIMFLRDQYGEHVDLANRYDHRVRTIEDHPLGWVIQESLDEARRLYKIEVWQGADDLIPLNDLSEKVLNHFGIRTRQGDDQMLIDVFE